ncbi:MAG TPA: glycoside hydrolase family 3 N-terminal domain-containing protein [Candidatus Binatia bacterium]|nr:glycoside hydrolase family 3 N-terminal domain-containing protein [Candidatus Binatia bacterium]
MIGRRLRRLRGLVPLLVAGLGASCAGGLTAPPRTAPVAASPTATTSGASPSGTATIPAVTPSRTLTPSRAAIPSPTAASRPTATPCDPLAVIDSWSLSLRAAQLVVVPADETDVAAAAPSIREGAGGVILFGAAAPADLAQQLSDLRAAAPPGAAPLVMTDEEGGGVQRMANLAGSVPWPATMAATMTPDQVRTLAAQTARRLAAAGVTMDLAPVLDLASGPGPDAAHTDGPRSFSPDAVTAENYGLAFAEGLEEGGIIPVVKHFPGEGAATANTDDGPARTPALSELEQNDLLPFEAAIRQGIPAVMIGNAVVPGLGTSPASLSFSVISWLLRQQLGFAGLVMTDALNAEAISALGLTVPEAAVEAVAAGADMVLYNASNPNATFDQVVAALVRAVTAGTIPAASLDTSVERVLGVKGVNVCASPAP